MKLNIIPKNKPIAPYTNCPLPSGSSFVPKYTPKNDNPIIVIIS
jgi:hypothetical protein